MRNKTFLILFLVTQLLKPFDCKSQIENYKLIIHDKYIVVKPTLDNLIDFYEFSNEEFDSIINQIDCFGKHPIKKKYKNDSILCYEYNNSDSINSHFTDGINQMKLQFIRKCDIKFTLNWNNTLDESEIMNGLNEELKKFELISENEKFRKYLIKTGEDQYYVNITRQKYIDPLHIVEQVSISKRTFKIKEIEK